MAEAGLASRFVSQITSGRNLEDILPGSNAKALADIEGMSPEALQEFVENPDNFREIPSKLRPYVKSVLIGAHTLITRHIVDATRQCLRFEDILTNHGDGFIIPYIERGFTAWKSRKRGKIDAWRKAQTDMQANSVKHFFLVDDHIDDAHFDSWKKNLDVEVENPREAYAEYMAENYNNPHEYMTALRREDSVMHQFFSLLLGEDYVRPVKKAKKHRPKVPWAFFHLLVRNDAELLSVDDTLEGLRRIITEIDPKTGDYKLDAAVDEAIELIIGIERKEEIEFSSSLFREIMDTPEGRELLKKHVEKLFLAYSTDETQLGITADGLKQLIGNRRTNPQAVVDEIVGSFALLAERIQKLDVEPTEAKGLLLKFLEIDGSENFFEMALRQVQHEHGYIFEQVVTLAFLKKGFEPHMIILQAKIGDKSGPDLLVLVPKKEVLERMAREPDYRPTTGMYEVRIVQMKSYKNLYSVIRATDHGAAMKQAKGDVRRLISSVFTQDKCGAENIGLTYSPVISYKIDWNRIDTEAFFVDAAPLRREIEKTLGKGYTPTASYEPATSLAEESPSRLLSHPDPKVKAAARKAFVSEYVEKRVLDINESLRTYHRDWARSFLFDGDEPLGVDQIRAKLIAEFKLRGDPGLSPEKDKFRKILAMLGEDPVSEAQLGDMQTALERIYRETFGLGEDGAIRVEVELVDAFADDTIETLPDWAADRFPAPPSTAVEEAQP